MTPAPERPPRRRFGRSGPKRPKVSVEDRIKSFVIRNSRMGFFTNMKTITTKFGLTEDEALSKLGFLLTNDTLECVHGRNGEIKLCESGKRLEIQSQRHSKAGRRRPDEKNAKRTDDSPPSKSG